MGCMSSDGPCNNCRITNPNKGSKRIDLRLYLTHWNDRSRSICGFDLNLRTLMDDREHLNWWVPKSNPDRCTEKNYQQWKIRALGSQNRGHPFTKVIKEWCIQCFNGTSLPIALLQKCRVYIDIGISWRYLGRLLLLENPSSCDFHASDCLQCSDFVFKIKEHYVGYFCP